MAIIGLPVGRSVVRVNNKEYGATKGDSAVYIQHTAELYILNEREKMFSSFFLIN